MASHPKEGSKQTLASFKKLVPKAVIDVPNSWAKISVDGAQCIIRVKRATTIANQVQVWRGEPLVVHVPHAKGDKWFVLPVSWQLDYALNYGFKAKQHASHAFDCMMIHVRDLPIEYEVEPAKLMHECVDAIREANSKQMRFVIKFITRVRNSVAAIALAAFNEEL